MIDVVTAIMINENKEIFIAKRSDEDKLSGKWEFPGGKIEKGETPEESLVREIKEEFGIKINVFDFLVESVYEYDFNTIKLLAYLVKWESGLMQVKEHSEVKWVSIDELDNYNFASADIEIIEFIKENKSKIFSCLLA